MPVLERLRRTVSASESPVYECRLCATRFEEPPLNCYACGSTAVEEI